MQALVWYSTVAVAAWGSVLLAQLHPKAPILLALVLIVMTAAFGHFPSSLHWTTVAYVTQNWLLGTVLVVSRFSQCSRRCSGDACFVVLLFRLLLSFATYVARQDYVLVLLPFGLTICFGNYWRLGKQRSLYSAVSLEWVLVFMCNEALWGCFQPSYSWLRLATSLLGLTFGSLWLQGWTYLSLIATTLLFCVPLSRTMDPLPVWVMPRNSPYGVLVTLVLAAMVRLSRCVYAHVRQPARVTFDEVV